MKTLSIITVAYDGYSRFIPRFIESVEKQTIQPEEVIIVLSDDYTLKEIPENVKIIKSEVLSWGSLLNKGIEKAKGDWVLCFDIDDILLENAVKEIKESSEEVDIVTLKYYEDTIRNTPEIIRKRLKEWRKYYTKKSGYVAFKKELIENTDFWQYPFLFKAVANDKIIKSTKNPCARYLKRPDGHGSGKNYAKAKEVIEEYANKYS